MPRYFLFCILCDFEVIKSTTVERSYKEYKKPFIDYMHLRKHKLLKVNGEYYKSIANKF